MAEPTVYSDVARQARKRLEAQAAAERARLQEQKQEAYRQVSEQLQPFKSELEESRQQQLAIVRGQASEIQKQADIAPRVRDIAKSYKIGATKAVAKAHGKYLDKIQIAEADTKSEIDKAYKDAVRELDRQVSTVESEISRFETSPTPTAPLATGKPRTDTGEPTIYQQLAAQWDASQAVRKAGGTEAEARAAGEAAVAALRGISATTTAATIKGATDDLSKAINARAKELAESTGMSYAAIRTSIAAHPEEYGIAIPKIEAPAITASTKDIRAKASELAKSTGVPYSAILKSVELHPEEYGLVPHSEVIDKYRQQGYSYSVAADLASFDVSPGLYQDAAGANVGLHSAQLQSGDVLDKDSYSELTPDAQQKIGKLGVEGYNKFLKKDTFTLPTGELMSKEAFFKLDPKYQNELYELGIEKFNEKYTPATKGEIVKETGLSLIPVYGTIRLAQKGAPAWEVALSAGLDLLWIIPPARLLAAGARGGVGLGRAIGKIALAEIKAPVTMLLHPIKTIKFAADPIETLVRLRKIPLESMEVSFHTIKVPSSLSRLSGIPKTRNTIKEALQASKQLTSKAIWGKKPVFTGAETIFKMPVADLQKISPVAMHMSPDIRPFLYGGKVTKTLSLAPNLHTRFTYATSTGVVPKGGIPGALLIRDEKILKALRAGRIDPDTGKLVPYKGTAEVEARLFKGTEIPAPVQTLITRDISGRKLIILVIGKKLTPLEILKLKLVAPKATIQQIFRRPRVKTTGRAKLFDKLTDTDSRLVTLGKQADRARGAEKASLRSQIAKLEAERANLARAINEMPSEAPIRAVLMNTSGKPYAKMVDELTRAYFDAQERGTTLPTMQALPRGTKPAGKRATTRAEPRVSRVTSAAPYTTPTAEGYKPPVPPTSPPSKAPVSFKTPSRISPEAPGYPPGPTPSKPPDLKLEEADKRKRKLPLGAVTWRQGLFWITIYPPYKTGDVMYTRKPPRGVSVAKGPKSAYETVAKLGFQVPDKVLHDMGIMDVVVTRKGQNIKFKRDIKQRTKLGYAEGIPTPGIKMGQLG